MADKQAIRQLKIKSGSLKRNIKDFLSYKKEIGIMEEKYQAMQQEGKDESDMKSMQL